MFNFFKKRTATFWLSVLFVASQIWDNIFKPIWGLNVENWAISKGLDNELVDGGQQTMPLVDTVIHYAALSFSILMNALGSQWFFGFVAGSIVFAFWDPVQRLLTGKQSVEGNEQKQQPEKGSLWAKGVSELSIRDAGCAYASINPSYFDDNAKAQTIAKQILWDFQMGYLPLASDLVADHPRTITVPADKYPRRESASLDDIVPVYSLNPRYHDRGWDNSWITD